MDTLQQEIMALKEQRKAVILAHNYQRPEVQDLADFVGDSLELARMAQQTAAENIIFCGVHFMAESAAILNPERTVVLAEREAGCPMADMVDAESLRRFKQEHPGVPVVTYVNSSAEVKAESDICCTSANAVRIVESVEAAEVIFTPDANLADYVARSTSKKIIPWRGFCVTHLRAKASDVAAARRAHPGAVVVAHPECRPEVVQAADHVASTTGMLRIVTESPAKEFIVGTEMGLLYRMEQTCPEKRFFLLHGGMICPNMKLTTAPSVLRALRDLEPRITVEEETAQLARRALSRMLKAG